VPHQEAVAEIFRGRRIVRSGRAIEHPERDLPAPVRDIEEESTVAAADGPEEIEVRRELQFPMGVTGRELNVDDSLVHG
jgi:hypothetical protein